MDKCKSVLLFVMSQTRTRSIKKNMTPNRKKGSYLNFVKFVWHVITDTVMYINDIYINKYIFFKFKRYG